MYQDQGKLVWLENLYEKYEKNWCLRKYKFHCWSFNILFTMQFFTQTCSKVLKLYIKSNIIFKKMRYFHRKFLDSFLFWSPILTFRNGEHWRVANLQSFRTTAVNKMLCNTKNSAVGNTRSDSLWKKWTRPGDRQQIDQSREFSGIPLDPKSWRRVL